MKSISHSVAIAIAIAAGALFTASGSAADFPEPSKLPSNIDLPNPLVMMDGRSITNETGWRHQRRPELKSLFQHYMYGELPPKPDSVEVKKLGEYNDLFDGKATMRLVRLELGTNGAPAIDVILVIPNQGRGPHPIFVGMNFCGNHALLPDTRIPLARSWLYSSCKGCVDGKATEAARGSQTGDWGIERIVSRGYAFAGFCSNDVDSDRADISDGLTAWLAKKSGKTGNASHRGTIGSWAWGYHRVVDYLMSEVEVDPIRIAVVGHSRNGKTALLAAALDERIALAIPHQAGCGGTAPSRGKIGESVKQINDRFPHWFNERFKAFNDSTDRLPFDQHSLVALMAPRPVLLSNAVEDQWANPDGQFEVLKAAEPVYKLLRAPRMEELTKPQTGKLLNARLGYFIRSGKHSMNAEDWGAFLDFADRHLKSRMQ